VLLALNRLWQVNLPRAALQKLALQLGADVPVFVFGQTAFAEGVGDILHPVSAPPAWYVVLMPPVQVPTAAIFAAPELTRNSPPLKIARFSAGMGCNDLQPVVISRYPEVARHLEWLGQFGEARMTGSGACVFASFGTEGSAREVLRQLPETMQGFVAQGLDRHPLVDYCAE
jgi:4-diphosphocytidyl-2-C-methyl-D-erythritol kinase